jgi:hypothetical protein
VTDGGHERAQVLLEAVMPTKMEELAVALNTTHITGTMQQRAQWGGMVPGQSVSKVALFPRVDADK